ncbi:MAG: methyl-accepting chemotaxis protein [Nibricoccus sp.]
MKADHNIDDSTEGHGSQGIVAWFRRWTIGRRLGAGFTMAVAITAALGIFALVQVLSLGRQFESVAAENIPSLEYIAKVEHLAVQNRLLVYKHISSSSKEDMAQLERHFAENGKVILDALDSYAKLSRTAEDREIVEGIKAVRQEYLTKSSQIFERSRSSEDNKATYELARAELDPIGQKYSAALAQATEHENHSVAVAAAEFNRGISTTKKGVAIGLVVAIVSGVLIGIVIARTIGSVLRRVSNSLAEGADQVASSSTQVSAASQGLAEGASEQAASLEETGSSLEEMAGMTRRNSESAGKANELARQARQAADTGATDMTAMKEAMNEIKASSDDISKIIKTIDEIAFQTNILALNAAVEAARAGAAGAGFAVVADEVRALAQRSAQAAKETAAKIESARIKSTQGVEISDKVAARLSEIVMKVRQVDELIAEVSTASREQSQGVGQITTAVSQMDKVVQASASSAEETAAAAEELSGQAHLMRTNVSDLLALVSGNIVAVESESKWSTAEAASERHAVKPTQRSQFLAPRTLRQKIPNRSTAGNLSAELTFKDI